MKKSNKTRRTNIPGWLSDPEGIAPCICGEPPLPDEPCIMATGEGDLKRWFHLHCWTIISGIDPEDWDDDE